MARPLVSVHEKWFLLGAHRAAVHAASRSRARNTGTGFSWPNGASRIELRHGFAASARPGSRSASIVDERVEGPLRQLRPCRRRTGGARRPSDSWWECVTPTAASWPAEAQRAGRSSDSTALNRLTWPTLRPQPRASSPSMVNSSAGHAVGVHQAAGHDALHALVPALRRPPPSARWPVVGFGRPAPWRSRRAPPRWRGAGRSRPPGARAMLRRHSLVVVAHEQRSSASCGVAHAAGGVQTRDDGEAEVGGGNRLAGQAPEVSSSAAMQGRGCLC